MKKPISVQLYSVREAAGKDFPSVLKRIAQIGYAGVEFAGLHNFEAKEIARIVKDLGMTASSAHVALPTKENVEQLAQDATVLGYKFLISGFGSDAMKTEDGVRECAEKFAQASELVKPYGLQFGMHNHWWEFDRKFGGKTPYEIFLNTAPEMFSELDIYWSSKAGADTVKVVRTWGKRIPLLHVKDGDLGEKIVHKAVGDGKVPVQSIITAADDSVLQWVVVELDACETDMFEAVEKSYDWLVEKGLGRGRT
ncbi:MAG: sugar phosphate isomerase/epimerase [Phycisphaerae bacterium]